MTYCHACGALQRVAERDAAAGDLTISLYGDCWWKGEKVPLTLQEATLVHALALEAGRFVRVEYLITKIEAVTADPLNFIHGITGNIRRKFAALDPGFNRLQNRRGFGYRWALEGQ